MPWPLGHVANAHGSFSDWGHPLSLSLSFCLALANIFTHACTLAAPSPLTSPTTGCEATIWRSPLITGTSPSSPWPSWLQSSKNGPAKDKSIAL
ncbi:unnamed protein product [Acanthoscelides obtectus]|uniref:Secreted protein n=1 Tax=Acanthoscelides obtectus TaxID=200917 RepID=A0A9P0P719_ACAOB|nr:unnamed protein product [Acanthoscelides obtectus]CAK1646934.1 hypothetical protein AOBTE_LOCUS14954 [Acanthoscelides obtectus]